MGLTENSIAISTLMNLYFFICAPRGRATHPYKFINFDLTSRVFSDDPIEKKAQDQ